VKIINLLSSKDGLSTVFFTELVREWYIFRDLSLRHDS